MTNRIKVDLKPSYLGFLGKACGQSVTAMSALNGQAAELSGPEIDELKKNGVLDQTGSIANGFKPVLSALAGADAFARLRLTKGRGLVEYLVYFSPDGSACSLLTEGDGLLLEYPADNSEFEILLEELFGVSTLRNTAFEAQFKSEQALVLAAALDITRAALLRALVDGKDLENADFSPEDLYQWLSRPAADAQWVSVVLKGILPPIELELSDIISSLDILVQSSFAVRKEARYFLSEPAAALASRFLVIDKLISLRAGREIGGQAVQVGFICLTAGVNDVLMLESNESSLFIETVTARKMLDYVHQLLGKPMHLAVQPAATSENKASTIRAASSTPQCVHCGGAVNEESKFCGICGNPIKPTPAFCGKCGREIQKGTLFCGGCGASL